MSDAVNGQNAGCIGFDQLPAERRFNGCGVSGEQNDRRVQSASSRSSSNENGIPLEQSDKRQESITDSQVMNRSQKRLDYLDWSEYFMAVAVLSAERSKDPSTQVGACIVDSDKRIVAIGYNGMPSGCSDDLMPWAREADDPLETKYPYVCHAEMNAILNKNSADLQGCVIYVVLFPCNECAKLIIQSGIHHIVYASDKYHEKFEFSAARRLFNTAGITYEPFCPRHQRLTIDLRRSICDIKDNCAVQKERVWHSLNSMRTDYITWSEYFVGVALLSAQRSKDPNTQVGACIVNTRNRIVAIGYNGMPRGCHDDHMPWSKDADNLLETKYPYVCHAEMNAIMNRNCMSLKDCTMYVTRFPCNECAKLILQSGIHSVFYLMDKHPEKFEYCAARQLFDMAGVEYKLYEGRDDARCIVIEFTAL